MNEPVTPVLNVEQLKLRLAAAGLSDAFTAMRWVLVGRFSNDVWRLDLDNGVRLLVKQPQRTTASEDPTDVERRFYRFMFANPHHSATFSDRKFAPIPCFVADLDGALILEFLDLEEFSFAHGVSAEHARAAIDALADWHAVWWQEAPQTDWLPDYADPEMRSGIQSSYDAAWQRHRSQLLEYAPQFEALGNALVGRLSTTLAAMAEPATLIHGDAHAENIPLTATGAMLLDWQEPRIANPGYDLAVFTTMSYRQSDRPQHEKELVERHAARLASQGCSWSDPWNNYRLGVLRRVARIVEIADLDFSSLPWVFRRSAVAAVTLKVGELIC